MIPTIVVTAAVVLAMLGIGGATTQIGDWYRGLNKPPWNPPNWAFGPAWTTILSLAGWAAALAWTRADGAGEHALVLALFALNVGLHLLWSPLFFNLRRPDWALAEVPWLWASILALMLGVGRLSPLIPILLAPYLAWVSFAAVLNLEIVRRNRPFGRPAAQPPSSL